MFWRAELSFEKWKCFFQRENVVFKGRLQLQLRVYLWEWNHEYIYGWSSTRLCWKESAFKQCYFYRPFLAGVNWKIRYGVGQQSMYASLPCLPCFNNVTGSQAKSKMISLHNPYHLSLDQQSLSCFKHIRYIYAVVAYMQIP